MDLTTHQVWREKVVGDDRSYDESERASVLRELDAILNSPVFQSSKRCQQFLSYVVRHRLEGNHERLKERTIGVDLFQRPAGYATGDDPVVRVQAGEVRRRLDQYYQATPNSSPVRIELHVGTYTPEFKWTHAAPHQGEASALESVSDVQETFQQPGTPGMLTEAAVPALIETKRSFLKHKRLLWAWSAVGLVMLAGLAMVGVNNLSRQSAPIGAAEVLVSRAFLDRA